METFLDGNDECREAVKILTKSEAFVYCRKCFCVLPKMMGIPPLPKMTAREYTPEDFAEQSIAQGCPMCCM